MDIIDKDKLRDMIKHQRDLLSQPIDFEQLEKDGLLKKIRKSGVWYEATNINLLPEHVKAQILEMSTGTNGAKVKFKKVKRTSF
ncbi:MAG: hypothetical protein A2287_10540 [Candidatus Melainabacteria bacterium RIFOXYA12_FULL_32_12]|nr:MAG: hypothetical protein A2287_10540 [Candidatus Melainabacteria bacterium RIFOXYA12_FULL_32_12]